MAVTARLRVAVAGVGHYHAGYYPTYLELVGKHGGELAGVSDPDLGLARERASRFGGAAYNDYRALIEETKPDFVIGLGRHVDMPDLFRYLVGTGIPFLMEKPWAVDAETVRELAALAESRGAWVAVPFSMRYSHWAETARRMLQAGELGRVSHIVYRMIRPGVQRYVDQGSPWMLRRAEAGGGVLLNLGVHGFDLCRYLTGEEPRVVSASVSNAIHGLDIEDYAFVTLRTPGGIVFHNEVAYTYPASGGNDDEQKVAAEKGLLTATPGGARLVSAGGVVELPASEDHLGTWERVVAECLDRVRRGAPPPTTAADCSRAVSLVFESYRLAEAQGSGLT